jgi:hypothetical protein
MSREAMRLALGALELYQSRMSVQMFDEAVKALRKALETEPFEYWNAVEGWVKIDEVREHFDAVGCGTIYKSAGEGRSPLYTAPQKKEWVGLTDEEVSYCRYAATFCDELDTAYMAELIEQALKEKNHG